MNVPTKEELIERNVKAIREADDVINELNTDLAEKDALISEYKKKINLLETKLMLQNGMIVAYEKQLRIS